MRDAAEQLSRIREEIASDLTRVEGELTEARTAAAQAEAGHAVAVEEWKALNELAARGGERFAVTGGEMSTTTLAAPLHSKLCEARDELLKPAERMRAQARTRVTSLEHRRSILLDSLGQIDKAVAGRVTRLPPAPKRVAPIIEFDNVQPRQAAS